MRLDVLQGSILDTQPQRLSNQRLPVPDSSNCSDHQLSWMVLDMKFDRSSCLLIPLMKVNNNITIQAYKVKLSFGNSSENFLCLYEPWMVEISLTTKYNCNLFKIIVAYFTFQIDQSIWVSRKFSWVIDQFRASESAVNAFLNPHPEAGGISNTFDEALNLTVHVAVMHYAETEPQISWFLSIDFVSDSDLCTHHQRSHYHQKQEGCAHF